MGREARVQRGGAEKEDLLKDGGGKGDRVGHVFGEGKNDSRALVVAEKGGKPCLGKKKLGKRKRDGARGKTQELLNYLSRGKEGF